MGAVILQWAGWLTSGALGIWSELEYDPNHGDFAPQWVGLAFVFALGVAITASVVRSRMRLSHTVVGAFKVGQELTREETERYVHRLQEELDSVQRRIAENSRIFNQQLNKED